MVKKLVLALFIFLVGCDGDYDKISCSMSCPKELALINGETATWTVTKPATAEQTTVSLSQVNNQTFLNNQKINIIPPQECTCQDYELDSGKSLTKIQKIILRNAENSETDAVAFALDLDNTDGLKRQSSNCDDSKQTSVARFPTVRSVSTCESLWSHSSGTYKVTTQHIGYTSNNALPNNGLYKLEVTDQKSDHVLLKVELTDWNGL